MAVLTLNSTFGLLQILAQRAETEGAFLEIPGYVLPKLKVLNLGKLDEETVKMLLTVFDEVKDCQLPSILDQLNKKDSTRVKIDKAVFTAMGVEISDSKLEYIYELLAGEIGLLRALMR